MPKPARIIFLSLMACSYACTPRDGGSQPFANPVMLSSRDGKLHVDLVAAPATYTIKTHRFEGMLYNGQYMPPVWRLRAGDILTVMLQNQLSEETNLHFHGLGVSPLNNGDNVFLHIAPGQTFTYQKQSPRSMSGCSGIIRTRTETLTDRSSVACPEELLLREATAYIRF